MPDTNWVQITAGFLGGGVVGAFVKQFFDYKKSKIQVINYNLYIKPFYNKNSSRSLASKIVIKDGEKDYKFSNLYTGTLSIVNSTQHDYKDFSFGLTYNSNNKFIQVQQEKIDRHHNSTIENLPTFENQTNQFDVIITPFNRKNTYVFDFIINVEEDLFSFEDLILSTTFPVVIKEVKSRNEFAGLVFKGMELSILPFIRLEF